MLAFHTQNAEVNLVFERGTAGSCCRNITVEEFNKFCIGGLIMLIFSFSAIFALFYFERNIFERMIL
jgi:hypothetical protein